MFRHILRSFILAFISVFIVFDLIGGIYYDTYAMWFFVAALGLLNLLIRPIFKTLSLPEGGIGFLILKSLLVFAVMYVLTLILTTFKFLPTVTPKLLIYGVMLPSKSLNSVEAAMLFALLYSLTLGFFNWLYRCNKK